MAKCAHCGHVIGLVHHKSYKDKKRKLDLRFCDNRNTKCFPLYKFDHPELWIWVKLANFFMAPFRPRRIETMTNVADAEAPAD